MANYKKGRPKKVEASKKVEENVKAIEEPIVETLKEEEIVKELEVSNGDTSVLIPEVKIVNQVKEEKIEEDLKDIPSEEEPKKEENKVSKGINQMFGYSWNGQEMDY